MFIRILLLVFILLRSCDKPANKTDSELPIEYDILWESAGDLGQRVYCLLNLGTILFAGTYQGLYISADSGQTWTVTKNGLSITTVRAMVEKDGNIFAAGGILDGGVCVSTDSGKSWTDAKDGLPNTSVSSLAVNGRHLYAGTFAYGVFISEDNGAHWHAINKGLPSTIGDVTYLAGDKNYMVACVNSDTDGVYLSRDNGSMWSNISQGLPPDHADFTSLLIHNNKIFVSADGDSGGVFTTSNYGQTWKKLRLDDRSISILARSGSVLIEGGFGGIRSSTDNGATWFLADNGLYPQGLPDINSILVLRDRIFAGLNFGGVYFLILPERMSF